MASTEEDVLVENTKLSKKWLAETMKTHFNESPVVNEVLPLGPEVLGFMSTMRRVKFLWPHGIGDKPASAIIKLPNYSMAADAWKESCESGHEMEEHGDTVIKMMHNCETSVYNCLSKFPEFHLSIPFLYCALDVASGSPAIVMEDLENSVTCDLVDGFTEKQLFAITDELVKLHTLSYKHPEVVSCGVDEKFNDYPGVLSQSISVGLEKHAGFEEQEASATTFSPFVEGVADQLYKKDTDFFACIDVLRRNYLTTEWYKDTSLQAKANPNAVLCHGDLWSPQILWTGDKIAGIVDWALCHRGSVTIDLMHVLSMCVPVELRHLTCGRLLDYYHDELANRLKTFGLRLPFTRMQLEEEYKNNLPYTAVMAVFAAGMWSNSPVLKRGRESDQDRIQEIYHRCKAIVEETNQAYGWK